MKFSVVIPVYNSEKTLKRCVASLTDQEYYDCEIILINDGSTDNSEEICANIASIDSRVRFITQENQGVAAARNRGMAIAEGEYILFVDSDDYVSSNYFQILNQTIEELSPDFIVFNSQKVGGITKNKLIETYVDDNMLIAETVSNLIYSRTFNSPWAKAFKRDLIESVDLKFHNELKISEDLVFNFSYVVHIKSIKIIENVLYYVIADNQESLSRKRRDYLESNLLLASNELFRALNNSDLSEDIMGIYRKPLAWLHYHCPYSISKEYRKYPYGMRKRRDKIKEVCDAFSNQKIKPLDLYTLLLSLPIRFKMSSLVDFLVFIKQAV